MDTILIGIAGGTGSGKTTLADKLVESFGRDEVSILRHDNYYKRHDDIPFEERAKLNYDHPDAFDTDLLCQHILELKAGKSIEMPVYDYAMHNRSDKTILVHPAPVIVLEGILLFVEKDLCDLMDIKVFVDTDADVRILRRCRTSKHPFIVIKICKKERGLNFLFSALALFIFPLQMFQHSLQPDLAFETSSHFRYSK